MNKFRKFFDHAVVQNALALYGVQAATYILPFVTMPYLTLVMGVSGWGLVAFAQSFGAYLNLVVEYGFDLSATREVARHREDQEQLGDLVAGVIGARVLLASGVIAVALLVGHFVPSFAANPALLYAAIFLAIAQGCNFSWYFQGIERMRPIALLDVATKVAVTIGIFAWVHSPTDGPKVLFLQGVAAATSALIAFAMLRQDVAVPLPTWSRVKEAMQCGWSMFLFRSSVSLYTVGNTFILGLFVSPQLVGYYAGAEKINKAFLNLLYPVTQALYPRLSYLAGKGDASKLARLSMAVMGVGGLSLGTIVYITAPLTVQILLGANFEPAVDVLRLLACLLPLVAMSNMLGLQWMLPLGLDKPFNRIILAAGALNLTLAACFAPLWAQMGMAAAVVLAEVFVTVAMYVYLRFKGLDPLTSKKEELV